MTTLFHNAHVYSGDPQQFAAGVLVKEGVVQQLFSTEEEAQSALTEIQTLGAVEAVDLGGQYLFPGFEDSHNHPAMMARMSYELDLTGKEEFSTWDAAQTEISRFITENADRDQYTVHGWSEKTWGMLTTEDLDKLSDKPLYLFHISWHGLVMNSAALTAVEEAGLTIEHEEGRVFEDDFQAVEELSLPNAELMAKLLPDFCQHLLKHGVTTVHDLWIATFEQLEAFVQLDKAGELPLRVIGYISPKLLEDDQLDQYVTYEGNRFRVAGVKVFLDGTIGLKTAAMHEPFVGADGEELPDQHDEHGHNQMIRFSMDDLRGIASRMIDRGLYSLAVHGIGDAAVDQIVTFFEEQAAAGVNVHQWRIEHCEMISEGTVARLAALGATAAMQPNFHWDIHNYDDRLGERVDMINPFRRLIEEGVLIAFGSDNMPTGPLLGMEYAVRKGGAEHQFMEVREALTAYTEAGSQIFGEERGVLEQGFPADMIVLSENPFAVEDLSTIEVVRTIVAGE